MLQTIAPRLWNFGRETVDALLANDSALRLPFKVASDRPVQPTAFAEVEYCFRLEDSLPRARDRVGGRSSGWKVLTSVGFYDSTEGQLIVWDNKNLLPFPPGSTLFIPPDMVPFSFTAVSEMGPQMFIMQSMHGDLEYFVANGCQPEPPHRRSYNSAGERKADLLGRAEILLARYPTIQEFDASTYSYRS